ncbi:MAG: cytoplasmic protein [Deltaproteobacteria bacterium]|nr:cytoplasmic protein [Deltaproteobacteria bacterium]
MPHRFFINQRRQSSRKPPPNETFREFDATELLCPKCGQAVPVRKRLLLVLPEGEKYEYLCAEKYEYLCALCATSVGTKVVRGGEQIRVTI